MAAPVIELEGVCKGFRIPSERRETVREHVLGLLRRRSFERVEVLDRVSLTLAAGETLGIMGRNGSGKTTLLKIICGIYPADRGRVCLRAPITPLLELGLGWSPELDAVDNIVLIGTVMGLSLKQARAVVDEVLDFAELERFASLPVKHFSSGMLSRLAYAVAFSAVNEVLVLDEIFAVGDAGFRRKCEERYRELAAAGHGSILVTHDVKHIQRFCDRALLLDGGRFVKEGSGAEIAAEYCQLLVPVASGVAERGVAEGGA